MSPSQLWLWRRWHTRKGSDSAKEDFRRGTHQFTCRTVHSWYAASSTRAFASSRRASLADRLSLRRNQPDDALFNCPLTVASDVGSLGFRPEEIGRLRTDLLKGGFLWVDDFWGTLAWQQWSTEIARVLPASKHAIVDVPIDDPMLRSMFEMTSVPQITNIQFWRGVGGLSTSERGSDSLDVHLRAIRDQKGRVMVLMTHNTDVADPWEREGEAPAFFYQFSPDGYALGINVLLYAMTH